MSRRKLFPRDSAEENLQKNLQSMPYYPFYHNIQEPPHYLFMQRRHRNFYILLVIWILLVICILIAGVAFRAYNTSYFWLLVLVWIVVFILWVGTRHGGGYFRVRTYAIRNFDTPKPEFEYYVGDEKKLSLEMYRVCIKREQRRDRSKVRHYFLVLDGPNIERVKITREDTSIQVMRDIGKDLANKIRINYFDSEDSSPHNVIHWEPGRSLSGPMH